MQRPCFRKKAWISLIVKEYSRMEIKIKGRG
jgi:hypothetical protein